MPNSRRTPKQRRIQRLKRAMGSQPRTRASATDRAYAKKRQREERAKFNPVEIRYACICPRNCPVHPTSGG